ncbi:MAG: type II toxin-antitoxin system VapB family antitoxin [Tepidisphaeraceae bacterium]|jgi:antitoxin VapB
MDTAKIFTTGRSQAVRLPKEFRFQTGEVCIKRIGSVVILFDPDDRLQMLLGALGQATQDFVAQRRQPKAAERRRPL